jgi:hypothetical protein
MKNKDKGRLAPFVAIDIEMMKSPAWRAMSFGARWLYVHLKRRLSIKHNNNGRIFLSHREVLEEVGGRRDSVGRWFRELQHYGFIVMTESGCLGFDGRGKAPHFRLTEHERIDGNTVMPPTKDFLKWDGTGFRDDRGAVLRARKWKQKSGPQRVNSGTKMKKTESRPVKGEHPGPQRVNTKGVTGEHLSPNWPVKGEHFPGPQRVNISREDSSGAAKGVSGGGGAPSPAPDEARSLIARSSPVRAVEGALVSPAVSVTRGDGSRRGRSTPRSDKPVEPVSRTNGKGSALADGPAPRARGSVTHGAAARANGHRFAAVSERDAVVYQRRFEGDLRTFGRATAESGLREDLAELRPRIDIEREVARIKRMVEAAAARQP